MGSNLAGSRGDDHRFHHGILGQEGEVCGHSFLGGETAWGCLQSRKKTNISHQTGNGTSLTQRFFLMGYVTVVPRKVDGLKGMML